MTSTAKTDKVSKWHRVTLDWKAKNKSSAIYYFQGKKTQTENEKHLDTAHQNTELYNINLLMLLNEVQCKMSRKKGY